jgi:gliding motility-associated-like protein
MIQILLATIKTSIPRCTKTIVLSFLLVFAFSLSSQSQTVSLSFSKGYIGTQGTNTNKANNIKNLSTLGISRVSFGQSYSGQFGGTQGNDLSGVIKLYLAPGATSAQAVNSVITLNGALNWRETTGSTVEVFGFIFNSAQTASINYNSQTYNISGGTTNGSSSTLGLKAYAGTFTFIDGEDRDGNAATSGLLQALNVELTNTPQPSTISLNNNSVTEGQDLTYNVTLTSATSANNPQVYTFSFSGTATASSDYTPTYTFSNGVINNGDGTLTIPGNVSSFTITVTTIDDPDVESSETLILNIGSKSKTGSIFDNDGAGINYSETLTNFETCLLTPSTAQSFDFSGNSLGASVLVSAPNGYEISTSSSGTYSSSISYLTSSGSISNTTVWVRLTGASAGTLTGTISISSGSISETISVSGTVSPASVGGTIAGSAEVCSGTNSTTLNLSGNTGSITKWQSSTSANFTSPIDITNTTTSLTASNLTATTYYRAVVQSGSCTAANSGTASITVIPASVGGTIAGSATICSGTNSTTLTLSGNTGTVTKWQSSTSANFTSATDITNTTTSLTASNLTTTTYYRAIVQSGSCTAANSGTATITVGPASVGGTIAGSASVCSGTNSTVLTLSGNTGNITKWQSAVTADFSGTVTDISNTSSSLTATNLATTTYYRAVVQSGSCTAANSGTASITVSNCIQANPDNNTTSVNIPVSGNVATNDVIAAGTNYGTPTAFNTNPTGATITIDAASGNYTFTNNKPGKYEFYVPVCGAGQTSNCQLTLLQITVLDPTIPNNLPVAKVDIAKTNLNTAVNTSVLSNDQSGNIGNVLVPSSVSIVTPSINGTAVANADGTITYTPNTGFSGNDSLLYKVCDNATPANCQTTFVYYKVLTTGSNSVTSAIDDYAFVNNNKTGTASVAGNVLSNDKNTAGSALTASLVTGPTTAQGTLTFNADGSYTFIPALGFNGPIDVVYNACTADNPAICAKATLHIVVNPPPTINPDFNSTNINTPVPGSINTNDIIPAGTTYGTPIASGNNPSGATISINAATGTYTFTASKPGKYIFNVPVCAASQTTGCPISPLQITVLDPNVTTNPPVANNDYSVTQLNTPVVTTILANDKPGNLNTSLIPTSIEINTAPKNGTATANKATSKSGSSTGIKSFSTNGTITYTPNPGFAGLDSLIYTVCDNANPANCEVATVYYTISTATPNNVLVANDDYNTSINRVPATGNVLLNDDYGGAALTASLITGPLSSQGVFALIADGTYSFTPAFGFTGPVDIIYQACSGTTCINATLHILVNVVPPPPPTVINATYVAGSKSNPTNIKSLVTVTPTGTTLQWCDPTGVICSSTPPTIPNIPGTYIWCVKSVDTVTQLSSTCAMDTVIILAPYTVMEVTKTVRSVQSNPDGSVLLTFVLKAANKTNAVMDSVSVIDDLTQTFKASSGYTVAALDVFGGLVKNSTYDGISNINLVTNQSKIAANSMDSAILKVLVASPDIFGSLTNTAVLGGKTKYGYVSVNSNDPLANPTDTTKRVPTGFNVPKADLIIAGGFSPNFDGYNDKWIIVRPFGTRVEVKVFNRWGNIVYQNADYKNDWNGIGSTNFMGQDVPDGTYFYIVNAVEPSGTIKKFTSSLTIVR